MMRRSASPNQVLAIVCVGIILANLDLFIVNVGLPNIARDFNSSTLEDLSWILNGYAITYASLLIFFGRLAERYRRNISFLVGVGLFTAASAACAMASSVNTLVAFRVLQAAGAALMTPTSLGLLLASFPPDRRGGAVRNWTAIGGLGAALGPLVGGALVAFNWRWIFIINVPIGVGAMLVGWRMLPDVPGHDVPRPNSWAAALVTAGIGVVTFAIIKGNDWGWISPQIALCVLLATALLGLFVRHCIRSPNPFVDPKLFRNRHFTGAVLVMAPYSAAFGGMLLSIALYEQGAWGWSAFKTGLAIAPGPLLVPVTSLLMAGRLIKRFGPATVVTTGILCLMMGLAIWATTIGLQPNGAAVVAGMVPTGIGVGLTFPTLMGVGVGSLPSSSFATGSGVVNMIRQAGLAIGVAFFVAIIGVSSTPIARMEAFHLGWWMIALIAAAGLVPNFLYIRSKAVGVALNESAAARVTPR
jgi:EmrB/QacA subfamily drug resistance transporter